MIVKISTTWNIDKFTLYMHSFCILILKNWWQENMEQNLKLCIIIYNTDIVSSTDWISMFICISYLNYVAAALLRLVCRKP